MRIISREKHIISRANISRPALNVLHRLHQSGFEVYLVGGSVRDLLLGLKPKDFDIATNARPEKVKQLFRNCRLIGRRFRLAHVFFGQEIIEVATFRTSHPTTDHPDACRSSTGMLMRDNVYGSMEDDAWRRDFSINALYYNIADFSVIDYTGGMADLEKRVIRILGDPYERYKEDPVRMLRAIRFAAKLDFKLGPETEGPFPITKNLLKDVSSARLFDEVLKLFHCGHAGRAFTLLRQYELFATLFPHVEAVLQPNFPQAQQYLSFILQACHNTDERLRKDMSLNPAFLFAVLLWPPLQNKIQQYIDEGERPYTASERAISEIILQQIKSVAIPKRFTAIMREIWFLQHALQKQTQKRMSWVLRHPRFRAAYDFLLLRAASGEEKLQAAVTKWTDMQKTAEKDLHKKVDALHSTDNSA